MVSCLVAHFKRRRVLGLHFSPIINAGGRDIRAPATPGCDFPF
jgi:hypothetical protein